MKSPARYYDDALEEMSAKRPNSARALLLLEKAHKVGDARATYALGTWYLHGRHVTKDLRKASKLIKAAAQAKIADALFDLAVSYEKGVGLKKSEKAAAQCYLEAALCGDRQAVFEVGRCLYYGIGFSKDRLQAKVWFKRSKALGIRA